MLNIRRGCFETNSSSMHSLVVTKKSNAKEYSKSELEFKYALREDEETKEKFFNLWEYCTKEDLYYERSPFQILRTPLDKLRYYSAASLMNCDGKPDKKKIKEIKDFIMKVTGITNPKNIKLYLDSSEKDWKTGRIKSVKHYGAVYGNDSGETPMHFIKRKCITLEDLVMNPQYTIIIDGDETQLFKSLFDAGIIDANELEDISTNKSFWNDDIYECSYYFYNFHVYNYEEGADSVINEIVDDILSYQHTFKLRLDPFNDLEKYEYNEDLIKKLINAIRAKKPHLKIILSLYNYNPNNDVYTFKPNWDLSIFDKVEYEQEIEDEEDDLLVEE